MLRDHVYINSTFSRKTIEQSFSFKTNNALLKSLMNKFIPFCVKKLHYRWNFLRLKTLNPSNPLFFLYLDGYQIHRRYLNYKMLKTSFSCIQYLLRSKTEKYLILSSICPYDCIISVSASDHTYPSRSFVLHPTSHSTENLYL